MKLLQKTLLASALSLAFAANADVDGTTGTVTADKYSIEGMSSASDEGELTLPNVTYLLQADYAANDIITIQLNGAALVNGVTPLITQWTDTDDDNVIDAGAEAATSNDELVISYVPAASTPATGKLIFRVTQKTAINTSALKIQLSNVKVPVADFIDSKAISLSYSVKAGLSADATPIDTAEDVDAITAVNQFDVEVDELLSRVIDVKNDRESFVGGGTEDSLEIDFTEVSGFKTNTAATVNEVTHVITASAGTFDFLEVDEDGVVTDGVSASDGDDTTTFSLSGNTLTAVQAVTGAINDVVFTFSTDGNTVLKKGSFTHAATIGFDDAGTDISNTTNGDDEEGTVAFAAANAGRWKLNGSEVTVPYMVYSVSQKASQVINLSNSGSQTGEISIEWYGRNVDEDGATVNKTSEPVTLVDANGDAVLSRPGQMVALAPHIERALMKARDGMIDTATADLTNERYHFTITTNVPSQDVTVYSAYVTDGTGARLVVNDSNGAKLNGLEDQLTSLQADVTSIAEDTAGIAAIATNVNDVESAVTSNTFGVEQIKNQLDDLCEASITLDIATEQFDTVSSVSGIADGPVSSTGEAVSLFDAIADATGEISCQPN